jgi:hypothetical protein
MPLCTALISACRFVSKARPRNLDQYSTLVLSAFKISLNRSRPKHPIARGRTSIKPIGRHG